MGRKPQLKERDPPEDEGPIQLDMLDVLEAQAEQLNVARDTGNVALLGSKTDQPTISVVAHSHEGRVKAGRRRRDFTKNFMLDLQEAWEEYGPLVIRAAMFQNPASVFNAVSRLMPKEIMVRVGDPLANAPTEALLELLDEFRRDREARETRVVDQSIADEPVGVHAADDAEVPNVEERSPSQRDPALGEAGAPGDPAAGDLHAAETREVGAGQSKLHPLVSGTKPKT
jgi:hypothetical protein